jgi:hypothetical protein
MEDDLYEFDEGFNWDTWGEMIDQNHQGLAITFVDKVSNEPVHGLLFVHTGERCKQLVFGDPMGNWSEPKYIPL